ncbi:T9SS type A sorting domain-containing protein [Psychroserpens algicola]|uniref:T9SS type A sorting domain-containing protein n=1 Tax=Psychroserpens algicola TaxID=1719034 RepID=A0ABT0HBG0_9FLAO|nr:T9SS type A sorting domain-containing protein [Psychroserpens algicola]MCK8481703.1 T9SS type A sorting domain-containing protein [Psychroserpens algicola]
MKSIKKQCVIAILIISSLFVNAQTQIGNDIDGLLSGDRFGTGVSISSDGNIVAIVGFSGNNGDGRIRVFQNIEGIWTLYGTDINGENFGSIGAYSVSLSADGNTMAFSSLGNFVRIYSYNSDTGIWIPKGSDISNNTSESNFGNSIKLSADGNTIVVGAVSAPNVPNDGVTQIFQYVTDSWNQVGSDINGLVMAEHSGRSVDMSSDGSIVAILNNDSARIYENVSGTWTLLGSEIPIVGSQFPNRAVSLSSNGHILAIGEPDFSDSLIQRGRVRVFSYESESWNQVGSPVIGEVAHYRTGSSVSLSSDGQVLAIGEIGSTSGSTDTGRTRIFKNQSNSWVQIGNAIFGEASLDYSGESISLSSDANTLIIGADLNDGNGADSGHARVFDLSALLSVSDFANSTTSLFPNPASNQFTIQLSEELELENVNIYSSLGKLVNSSKTHVINTSKLTSGIYVVEIYTNKAKITKKLVVN